MSRRLISELLKLPVQTLSGEATTWGGLTAGRVALVVNVASECGLTPQYSGLEALHEELRDRGFTVIGVPCNQFGGQEPGTAAEIESFCSSTYGVTFPLTAKLDVNGPTRDAAYDVLTETADSAGASGDVEWNFEKFLLSADGRVLGRFRPEVEPDDADLRALIDAQLSDS